MQRNDGAFVFDSYWNDSTIIMTQVVPDDNWIFFKDTTRLYYKATVTGADTMTFLHVLDSVKTIVINAYNDSGIVASDPLNGLSIILSKNNGFMQVFDLYTFPYHCPDSSYTTGLDFCLDISLMDTNWISGGGTRPSPTPINTLFSIVDFINPNDQQLYAWDSGTIIESMWAYAYPPMYPAICIGPKTDKAKSD